MGTVRSEKLYRSPNELAPDYTRFDVAGRLLLTGHSHQAWPDVAFCGQMLAFNDAAELADGKWERAFLAAEAVRVGYAKLLGVPHSEIALGASTHDLLVRLLSTLPLRTRPRIVTTDGEFHSARRQFDRLAEEGIELVRVSSFPAYDVGERLSDEVDDRTALVLLSAVFFESGAIAGGLDRISEACALRGAALLVDAYHALSVVPYRLDVLGLKDAFVMGGGYKYCQLGEGNCFLRVPPGFEPRPLITGWFAEFEHLEAAAARGKVEYGQGASAFAGATYDPVSHYRAREVFRFFEERGLSPELLNEVYRHQVGLLRDRFDALDIDQQLASRDLSLPLEQSGGFVVIRSPKAAEICRALAVRGVSTDTRGHVLRLGPAPYLCDEQLETAICLLGEVISDL